MAEQKGQVKAERIAAERKAAEEKKAAERKAAQDRKAAEQKQAAERKAAQDRKAAEQKQAAARKRSSQTTPASNINLKTKAAAKKQQKNELLSVSIYLNTGRIVTIVSLGVLASAGLFAGLLFLAR